MQILAPLHPSHNPTPPLGSLLKEILVLLKRPPATLGHIHPAPPARERVRDAEDDEEPVFQVVEHERCEQRHRKVREAPDDDADGGALRAAHGGVDLRGHEPRGDEPADAEDGGCKVEDYGPGDGGGQHGYADFLAVHGQPAKHSKQAEGNSEPEGTAHHEPAAAVAVDEHPRGRHHDEVEDVVAQGDVLSVRDAEAEEFEDLRPVDGDGAVARQGLVHLAHDGDDGGVKLGP